MGAAGAASLCGRITARTCLTKITRISFIRAWKVCKQVLKGSGAVHDRNSSLCSPALRDC